ncbi:MAG: type II toxin-antitoxin system YafQ family toxin [Desulfobulbaceae bacterium]|jgi:mRNA interferase YafQ|nr:type II toxin-antitoxin system YafQ family toxin [Desulfobulbaceae bacterium]
MGKLKALVDLLVEKRTLPASYNAHPLKGKWKPHWDAHIEADWLLLY